MAAGLLMSALARPACILRVVFDEVLTDILQ
jgi:hypothetical protein